MIIRLLAIFSLLAALSISHAFAQRWGDRDRETAQQTYNIEIHSSPGHDTAKGDAEILYRIPYDFFVFARNTTGDNTFKGESEITIELLPSENVLPFRKILQRELSSATSETDTLNHLYLQGAVTASIPPGTYKLMFDVIDLQSHRQISDHGLSITVPNGRDKSLEIDDLIFAERTASSESLFIPVNRSGNIPFGKNTICLIRLRAPGSLTTAHPVLKISRIGRTLIPSEPILIDSNAIDFPLVRKRLIPLFSDSALAYSLQRTTNSSSAAIIFPVHGDTLDQGDYEISFSMRSGSATASIRRQMSVIWLDMPRSLRNKKTAIDALAYLMQPEEFDKISHAGEEMQDILFREFWKERDPTPRTSWNELMDEYYRRVDYAMAHFGTFRQGNGMRTDRGRVYILNGPPSSVQRELTPGQAPQETWEYATLHKRFIFRDESRQGNYKLLEEHGH